MSKYLLISSTFNPTLACQKDSCCVVYYNIPLVIN